MFAQLRVDSGSLRIARPGGAVSANFFQPFETHESDYTTSFSAIDPIRAAANRLWPNGTDWSSAVKTTEELVPGELYRKSDFYQYFARPHGQNHYLVGAVGDESRSLISVYREEHAFSEEERQVFVTLMPHVQRAVQLHHRMASAERDARLGNAAFEALSGGALVVDTDMQVHFANSAARQLVSRPEFPLVLVANHSRWGGSGTLLSARNRIHLPRLRSLIEDAAQGGSGGGLRLEINDPDRLAHLAIIVSPHPDLISQRPAYGVGEKRPVLVMLNELSRPRLPGASILGDLFGLSIAEQAVAIALLGGQTAETVAAERNVSLETVRSQIRTLLRKTDAANLRDFERIGALLTSISWRDSHGG